MSLNAQLTQLVKRSFAEMMKDVGTSIPGHFLSFDPITQLAQVQIGVVRIDVNGQSFTPPPIIECPVYIYGTTDHMIELEINPNDECYIMFSQRCIDAWIDQGGAASQPIVRFHDFSDAVCFPGIRSQPNKISNYSNNGIKIRNKSGDKFIWLKNDGTGEITLDELTINAPTTNINGDIIHDGNQTTSGTVASTTMSASESLMVKDVQMSEHKHDDSGTYNVNGQEVAGTSGKPI